MFELSNKLTMSDACVMLAKENSRWEMLDGIQYFGLSDSHL